MNRGRVPRMSMGLEGGRDDDLLAGAAAASPGRRAGAAASCPYCVRGSADAVLHCGSDLCGPTRGARTAKPLRRARWEESIAGSCVESGAGRRGLQLPL